MRGRIAAVLFTTSLATAPVPAATHHVDIQAMSFSPAQLTIAQGDTVTWTLRAGFHTTTSDSSPPVWDSGTMSQAGQTFSFTFANSGTFPYHCSIHPMMTATITVSPPAQVGTTTSLESSANPTVSGQNGTLTATVTKTGGGSLQPSGSVTFTANGSALCSAVPLSGGTASCSTSPLAVGTHSIGAAYSGDANFAASSSAPLLQSVGKASTTTSLSSSANPSVTGQNVTFTASCLVTSPGAGTPTGTVTFMDGGTALCAAVAVSAGSASCSTAALSAGTHAITAAYSGEARFEASTSPEVSQVVQATAGPAALSAFAPDATRVTLSWSAVGGASSYEVHRSSLNAPLALRLTTTDPAAMDTSVSAETTYVYKVRAIVGGVASAFSAPDVATTIVYTSDSVVRAAHIAALRRGVNAMRAAAGLPAAVFTDDPLAIGTIIRAAHVLELRSSLDEARAPLGVPPVAYSDPAVSAASTPIRLAHVTELRAGTQ